MDYQSKYKYTTIKDINTSNIKKTMSLEFFQHYKIKIKQQEVPESDEKEGVAYFEACINSLYQKNNEKIKKYES